MARREFRNGHLAEVTVLQETIRKSCSYQCGVASLGYLRETKSKQKRNPKGAIPVFGFKISVQNNSGLVEELRALRTTEPSPQSQGLVLTLNLGV